MYHWRALIARAGMRLWSAAHCPSQSGIWSETKSSSSMWALSTPERYASSLSFVQKLAPNAHACTTQIACASYAAMPSCVAPAYALRKSGSDDRGEFSLNVSAE